MGHRIDVHDTAYMTSAFRASEVSLSMDPYAYLWLNENAVRWSHDYLSKVSIEEAAAHCMRNRYFLDRLSELHNSKEIEVLINFGSGFSMYPYLLPESLSNIEIDKPEIVEQKSSMTSCWQTEGILPKRDIHYVSVDFKTDYQESLRSKLISLIDGRPTFILLEGVLFFLEKKDSDQLFDFFASIQTYRGYVGTASFRPSLIKTKVWARLMDFVKETAPDATDLYCLTLEDKYYRDRTGYSLLEVEDFFSLAEHYGYKKTLAETNIHNECFYLLRKS